MSSSQHGRVFWRPSELDEDLLPFESPPVLMWTESTREVGEVVQAHETPMGACLLSPKSVAGWGSRRKVKYVSSSEVAEVPQIGVKPSSGRKAKKRSDAEPDSRPKGSKVDRWSRERYRTAELKLVEIMRAMGAGLGSPVLRQELRAEVRKHIGDTGLLDHLLKHMVGRVVADNGERLRRRHNSEGAMEYWLEPADLAEITRKAGVIDPYWVPSPGWNLGDAISLCPFGGAYCKKETSRLREEVALLKRGYQRLLQWKSKMEEEIEGQVVEGHETRLEASLMSPLFAELSGWGTRRKVMYNRRHREMPSSLVTKPEAGWEQQFGDKRLRERKDDYHKLRHGKEAEKKRRKEKDDDDDQESRTMGSKVDRWSLERYEAAQLKLVEIMHDLGANMGSPILRQMLREKMRKHIGDTGLLDHLLKHMVGKIVADGTERLQRRHNAEGAMEYWLEPANFVEIRQKAGVLDPCWVPPPGWKLGDSTLPCPCSAECKKEMNWLRKEVTILKREVERLKALVQLGNQAKEAEAEAGGLPELAELEEQVGREDGWYVRLFSGTEGRDVVDERRGQEAQVWRIL